MMNIKYSNSNTTFFKKEVCAIFTDLAVVCIFLKFMPECAKNLPTKKSKVKFWQKSTI